jgi:flagellar biosynthesis protein FlhF
LRRIVEASIRGRLRVSSTIGLGGPNDQSTVVFVGPPGAGKTTTLAKIAVKRCLAARLTVRIVSVDAERVGSHERLRTLAGVMGIGFTAANSIPELQDALKESRTKDCLLIDTPGFGNGDSDAARDLALVLNRAAPCDIHLVLPACAKRADLAAFADRFGVFRPGKLLFTRLDETSSLGCVVSEALRLEKPLSFFSTGQSIPDDLQEANAEMLVEKLFAADAAAAASAA